MQIKLKQIWQCNLLHKQGIPRFVEVIKITKVNIGGLTSLESCDSDDHVLVTIRRVSQDSYTKDLRRYITTTRSQRFGKQGSNGFTLISREGSMPTAVKKPRSQLFKDITNDVFNLSYQRLQEMRKNYPHYRDDELLMFMLCAHDSIVVVQAIRDAMDTQRRCDAKIARTATYTVSVHPGTEPRGHPEKRPIEHREMIALAIELGHSIE